MNTIKPAKAGFVVLYFNGAGGGINAQIQNDIQYGL